MKTFSIILMTGASGSGKTTVAKALEREFSPAFISINYFDDIGVPSIEQMIRDHGAVEKWQEWATHAWIEKLVKLTSEKLVFLEGSFNPEFAVAKMQELDFNKYHLICLHADKDMREQRLIQERLQPELVTQDMENFAQKLRAQTIAMNGIVLDTTNLSVQEIIQKIRGLIRGDS